MRKERLNEIWGVLFLLLGLFALASLVFFHPDDISFYTSYAARPAHNVTGLAGAYLAFGLLFAFGVSAYIIPGLFLLWSSCFFLQKVPERKLLKFVGLGIALISAATIVTISVEPENQFLRGGAIGYLTGTHLLRYFGLLGSYIVAASCLLLSLLLATDFLIYPLIKAIFRRLRHGSEGIMETASDWRERAANRVLEREEDEVVRGKKKEKKPIAKEAKLSPLAHIPMKIKQYRPDLPESVEEEKPGAKEKRETKPAHSNERQAPKKEKESASSGEEAPHHEGVIASKPAPENGYTFPPIEHLRKPTGQAAGGDNLQENSRILEGALAQFGIEVKVVEVEQGPVITRYELMPAPGVKVNSISALSDDLALALKAHSIRLIVPIPGKSAVGVEVPNSVTSIVSLREMIETREFKSRKQTLPLVLGKDTSGQPLIADLTKMPHILIAGATGSGKTVCVNSIIMGLLYYCSPQDLKMVMIDPKMVEMAVYNKIPHMLTPVVTNIKKAANTLNWVVNEMENRYRLFATVGVRNIQSFNSRPVSEETIQQTAQMQSENVVPVKLPYIVLIIDELADLMMVAQDKVETAITRLAQLARAVGIHLILATQRPSVDVITGLIKANFPARISFKVASKVDSRTVLDTGGADALIGRGDMLFLQPGAPKPIRGQAPLVEDKEINEVVKFVTDQAKPEYHPEIMQVQEGKTGGGAQEKDEIFDEAVAIVLETGQASTSNLQRRLRLGYTRAARIIDQMEAEGLIGPAQGAKARDIYIDQSELREPVAEAAE